MRSTIFATPVIRHILPPICRVMLFCMGWKIKAKLPKIPKYVIIAAPHTSNWDYFFTMLAAIIVKVKIRAMGKKSLTEGPFGFLMEWFGIIPIDRSKSNNIVNLTIDQFNSNEELIIMVPPSGTRGKVQYWKTGFYYIASGANVPISLGYVDYGTKTIGLGPMFYPTGDIDKDMTEIKSFYDGKKGKYPELQVDYEENS